MDYKKIIPNRNLRLKILDLMDFVPDKLMLKIQYFISMKRRLNLDNPKRFTEKLQWYKLYYRDPLMTKCVDKYKVRSYVSSKGYEDILVPLYGVYNSAWDINFDKLPSKFVFKTNNGSQTNILCDNKSKLDYEQTIKLLDSWLNGRTVRAGREWPYYNVRPKIICEKLLETKSTYGLVDYKFICFNGKVSCLFVNSERNSNSGMTFGIYNKNFEKMHYKRKGLRDTPSDFPKPKNYNRMLEIAEVLSEDFPHVRVDLYNINGDIYFSELTFFHGSGYIEFEPDDFDFLLGDVFQLPKTKVKTYSNVKD